MEVWPLRWDNYSHFFPFFVHNAICKTVQIHKIMTILTQNYPEGNALFIFYERQKNLKKNPILFDVNT